LLDSLRRDFPLLHLVREYDHAKGLATDYAVNLDYALVLLEGDLVGQELMKAALGPVSPAPENPQGEPVSPTLYIGGVNSSKPRDVNDLGEGVEEPAKIDAADEAMAARALADLAAERADPDYDWPDGRPLEPENAWSWA
jgi:hypothetical protein